MSKLNKDILFLLFEELRDDSKSLFSCLLVNKNWLGTALTILWRNPWRYEDNVNYRNKISLYYLISFSLSNDIKEFLRIQGVQLPPISYRSPLFDYLFFCRSINVNVINNIISIGCTSTYNQFLLQQEIYSLLMRKCPELKYLNMRSLHHQIFFFPEAKARIRSLCELKCDTSIDPTYFYGLANICKYVQRLIVINTSVTSNNGIVKLIEAQENLKYFEWKDDFNDIDDLDFTRDIYKESFLALMKKADTLIHFVINLYYYEYYYTPLIIKFSKFLNLKTLKIDVSYLEFEDQLRNSTFHNLEYFQIDFIEINTVVCIIKNCGGRLRKILIDDYNFHENFYEESLILIRTIYEHCPLVEYLTLTFLSSKEHFFEFEKLLETCQKLKVLLLEISESINDVNDYKFIEGKRFSSGEKLLNVLVRSAPINLREIRFLGYFKLSSIILEEFLENWRGRPALLILTSDHDYEKEEYVKIISKYKIDGVIKDFKYVMFRLISYI